MLKQAYKILLILPLTIGIEITFAESYYKDRERGWFWYEDPPVETIIEEPAIKEKNSTEITIVAPSVEPVLSPKEQLTQQGKEWEESLALVILDPTPENYSKYLELTSQIQDQAYQFTQGFKQAVSKKTALDLLIKKSGIKNLDRLDQYVFDQTKETQLHQLGNKYGLVFFLRGDCPYCHKFSPVLKKYADQYGFTVIPVSLDGGSLPEFPYPKINNQLASELNVQVVPSLFLIDPKTNKTIPVTEGLTNWSSLIDKTLLAAKQAETASTTTYLQRNR